MGIGNGLCFAAVCASFVTYGASARAQGVQGGGGGTLVGVGTEDTAPAAAPARTAVYVAPARRESKLPVAYVDRPLTNPADIISPLLEFDFLHPEVLGGAFGGGGGVDTIGSMKVGAGVSITDNVSVRGTAFVLQFNPRAQLAEAALGFTYRIVRGDFELGVGLDWIYQTPSTGGYLGQSPGQDIVPSLPMRVHLGHAARIDITPSLPISTAGIYVPQIGGVFGGKTTLGLDVPVMFNFQVLEPFHIDVGTGLNMTFNPDSVVPGTNFGDFFAIPFGFDVGISVPGPRGPILDMTPYFVWPELFVPGIDPNLRVSAVQSGLWTAGLNFTVFLYL